MEFVKESYRYGDTVLSEASIAPLYLELENVINDISDQDIISKHQSKYSNKMSLSYAINDLLKERLTAKGWSKEVPIFQEKGYSGKKWRIDFAKDFISIEVAFNHGEAIAWNLLKPVLASEDNNIDKAIQTKVGIVICATKELKKAGAFDNAVGEFEKFKRYLKPMSSVLITPMLLIGLKAPKTFKVSKRKVSGRNIGEIVSLASPIMPQELVQK